GGREESFRQGIAATMQTWSVGAPGYYDPSISKIVDKVAITKAPRGAGLPKVYGIGGWGMEINAGIKDTQKEAAWAFIKWLVRP
ncbi:extracellular solute-binding protein, partial [Rhizobium ruizarguesonis]